MRLSRRRRYSPFVRRQRRRNVIPLLTFLVAFAFVIWLGAKFFGMLFSNVHTENSSAEITILKGRAEFTFSESETWTPAYSEQKFLAGDSIRTSGDSRISLEFLGGNMIFLDENSELHFEKLEEKNSGKKFVALQLKSGRIWARVSDEDFNLNTGSQFTVETERSRMYVRGTIFDFSTGPTQDVIRLIKGNVDVDVWEGDKEKNITVGVGQKLVISPTTISKIIEENGDVLEIIDTEFIESEWHLQNLDRFFPQEVAQIRRRIEITAPQVTPVGEVSLPESSDLEAPKILTPTEGEHIPAGNDTLKIEGTAPLKAVQIIVNGYTLTRFQPGDRKWAYFASKKFGTMQGGQNVYSVVAVSRDGKRSPEAKVTIFYEGEGVPVVENTEPTIDDFQAPVVTSPPVIVAGEPYQTSAEVVTITGIVDPKTNMVEVNGFRLEKFQPGQTEFKYIANAKYGNMKEGENVYEIMAHGPDGKQATTTIRVVYTPLSVTP